VENGWAMACSTYEVEKFGAAGTKIKGKDFINNTKIS